MSANQIQTKRQVKTKIEKGTLPKEKISIQLSFPIHTPKKEGDANLDASKYTLPFNLGMKLVASTFIISTSLAAFYNAQSYMQPFFDLVNTSSGFDAKAFTSSLKGMLASYGGNGSYLTSMIDSLKSLNKGSFDVPPIIQLRVLFETYFKSVPQNFYTLVPDKLQDTLLPVLYDENLAKESPMIFRQFFSILLFVLQSRYTPILIGVVGGSALVYNFPRKLMRTKAANKAKDELSVDAEKFKDYIGIISKIGEHFGFALKEEKDSNTHVFLNFEHIMDGESKHIQQYKHFLKALPQNVFINQVDHVLDNNPNMIFPPTNNVTRMIIVDKKVIHIREQLKKYADLHMKRYSFQYPSTLTQKLKSYVIHKPTFSQNSLS